MNGHDTVDAICRIECGVEGSCRSRRIEHAADAVSRCPPLIGRALREQEHPSFCHQRGHGTWFGRDQRAVSSRHRFNTQEVWWTRQTAPYPERFLTRIFIVKCVERQDESLDKSYS